MVYTYSSQERQILFIEFAGHVTAAEVEAAVPTLMGELEKMNPGFILLTDFSDLESMDTEAARPIAANMDSMSEKGIGSIVRVIPDPTKDIGFQLMGCFHYEPHVQTAVFDNLGDALKSLES